MKAFMLTQPGQIGIVDIDQPVPAPGETLVHVRAAGVCGSDLHGVGDGLYPCPNVIGHEFAGITGDGRRVAVNPQVSCGACAQCTAGATHLCTSNNIVGITRGGGLAEAVVVPEDRVVTIPDGSTWTAAAMSEVVAVGLHAVNRGHGARGKRIGVLGAGPVGLCAALSARDDGADEIVITDISSHRRTVAEELHIGVVSEHLATAGFDMVIDAVGSREARAASVAALRPGGTAVWVGGHDPGVELASAMMDVVGGERSITGSFAYTDDEFAHAAK